VVRGEDAERSTVILLEVLPRNVGGGAPAMGNRAALNEADLSRWEVSNFCSVTKHDDGMPLNNQENVFWYFYLNKNKNIYTDALPC
jgi:hypothetical protein